MSEWTHAADVVVIGSGAAGLPAAIVAREAGASVIVVEAEDHVGGHAIVTSGGVALGGGTSAQRRYGIADSPELLFRDLTDWSVTQANGAADYRYNDRELVRAYADNCAQTHDWLSAHGVVFVDAPPDNIGGISGGNSVPRTSHVAVMDWPMVQTGRLADPAVRATLSSGNGLVPPLERAARAAGVEFLLAHRMTALRRAPAGRVDGITAEHRGAPLAIAARKAVIVATGGSTGNVAFRRMFDPRLTAEYALAGMPWSNQDASGELAALAAGAALWGLANQTGEYGHSISKPGFVGCRYGYRALHWQPGSPVFAKARASGLRVGDWQNVITVNMLGRRFYDETAPNFGWNNHNQLPDYVHGDWRNAAKVAWQPQNYVNAALAGIGDGHNGGGPIWAIFDREAIVREGWNPEPPQVDVAGGFFFRAGSLAELATAIHNPHQRVAMPPAELEATVARYNAFVDAGHDADFGKPAPRYAIATPPFYAAWATPVLHDTRAGLRIDAACRVVDLHGNVIPGLYCGGESAGGFSFHGLGRALTQGRIAGAAAAAEP